MLEGAGTVWMGAGETALDRGAGPPRQGSSSSRPDPFAHVVVSEHGLLRARGLLLGAR